jgi:ribosomal protein L16/L10AE
MTKKEMITKMQLEETILVALKKLKRENRYIALQLHPAIGHTTIEKERNTLRINEGRDGKFEGVSESFYDEMVNQFDSRN